MSKKTLSGMIKVNVRNWHENKFHKIHRIQALKAIEVIEKYNSQKFTLQSKKFADDYAIQIFGNIKYAPWLYVYSLMRGEFKEGWIPDNFYCKFVAPRQRLNSITVVKTFTNVILRTELLPDIAYFIDGVFYDREYTPIKISDLTKLIGKQYSEVYVKSDSSSRGLGVQRLGKENINENVFKKIGNSVIQLPIKQHQFFKEIISSSIATLRISTVRNLDGNIEFRASYLRLGRKDTGWVQSNNSIRVAVLDQSGELDTFGYTSDWRRWSSHPDTNYIFSKKYIPLFKDAVDVCIKLHSLVPHFRIIGWDIGISNTNEIKLMEWNAVNADIKFSEATIGPCFTGLNWEELGKP